MMQLYRVILTIFCSLVISGLYAQPFNPHLDPCDAEADPVPYGTGQQTRTLVGDIINNAFTTDLAGGNIQDFGVVGADSSAFYKLNFDENASFIHITWVAGSLDNLSVGLFSVTDPCGGATGSDYGEMLYQDPDGNNLLEEDLTSVVGSVTFELCNLDPADYDNIYLWLASSEVGNFEITVMQRIRPENNDCDFTPEDLGEISPGMTIQRLNESNQWACRNNLVGSMCLTNAHDGAGVWYEFTTDDVVELIDLVVEHDNEDILDVAILELTPNCTNFNIVACVNNTTDGEIEFLELAVKRNTTYYIFVNTPQDDWGNFDLILSACAPPPNFSLCDHEVVDFPGLAHNPNNPIPGSPFVGTTECGYPFYNNNAQTVINEFGCGYTDMAAVYYKLDVDPNATKLVVSGNLVTPGGTFAAQVIMFNSDPDCVNRGYAAIINESWGQCNFATNDIEVDLCDKDNSLYEHIYLMVATNRSNEGEFNLNFYQEIAPYNDLCDDPSDVDRGVGDLGVVNHNANICENSETNRGACPVELGMPAGEPCLQGFEDEPMVWYTFETGDDVELVDITVDHDGNNLRVAIFEMSNPCGAGTIQVPGGDLSAYCSQGGALAEFEQLTVKSNTVYQILVSTPEANWNDFSICIEACEPPENYDMCNAQEINYPGPAHNPDLSIPGSPFAGNTNCAYGFFDDVNLNDLIHFDCGDDFESAVFYKLNVDEYATKLEIEINKLAGIGTVAAQVFIYDGTPDCDARGFDAFITIPDGVNSCNFVNANRLVMDLCEIDNDDYDNLYLWIATSKEDQGNFTLNFFQEIAPTNDLCDDPSDVNRGAFALGVINHNSNVCENNETNRGACPAEIDMPAVACLEGFEDEATVWYTFETGDDVELVDITVDHDGNNLRVAVFEMTNPCMSGGFEVPGGDLAVYCTQGGSLAEFEQLTVKSNTTYYILVSTPEANWDDFSICIEACEPPDNFDMCNAQEINYPGTAHNPDLSIPGSPFAGTTLCAYGFFDDVNLNELIEFDCGDDFESAVFYKLNVDDYASKLEIEINKLAGIGTVAAQVFIYDGTPDCDARGFDAFITIPDGDGFNSCNFVNANRLVMDLCEIDNDDYDNLYLWIATSKEDQGNFTLNLFQEIAPYNDLCEDNTSGDRGAGDLGVINHNDNIGNITGCTPPPGWTGTQTNRGACPVEFNNMPSSCLEGFEDEATVWYTFETGDDVEEVNITVEHNESTNLRVAVFEMLTPCMVGTLQVPGNNLNDYCQAGGGEIEFEKLTLKANTVYYILVSTPEDEWGEFTICIEACEPPENFDMCNAEELDFPALGDYNPDNPALDTDGNTECAFGFFNDVNLSDLIHFDCGDQFESAVFYKLNVDEYASKLEIAIDIGTAGVVAAQVFIFDGVPDCENNGFNPSITIPTEDGFNRCNFTSALNMEMDLCGIDNDDYDKLYLWIATSKEDQGDFDLEFFQEIAPYNDLCDDDSDGDRAAGDLGVINLGDETGDITGCTPPAGWTGDQTNRGACPIEFGMPTACLQGFEDEATVWYTFETGDNVELVDIFVEHTVSTNLRVAIFEMLNPCMAGVLQVPGNLDDYCTSGGGEIEFEDLTVQPNTVYFIIVSTPEDEWGELSICIEACQPPDNYNICDAEELNFPGLGGYDPDNPALEVEGDTECSFGFFNDVQLTELIEFDCGIEFDAAVYYKLNVDEFATKLEIAIEKGTAGVVAAQVFFFSGDPDCENRGFLASITIPTDNSFNSCNFSEGVNMEMDLCDIDNALYEDMYLWIATSKDEWGDFELIFYQEIAPENDECEDAIEVGTIMPGGEICETGTTRGACPILYTGPTACFDGFPDPDEAGVWYTFETGEDVELLSVSIDHTNSSNVRLALFELPDGCGENGVIPADPNDYCVEATNGADSIWNILVKQETQYYLLVSTPVADWGEFDICITNCEPPENDTACDAVRDPDFVIEPGHEVDLNDRGDPTVVEGTTVCANNFFVDFDLTYIDFDCGAGIESAVFYKIDVEESATELWITGTSLGPGSLAFALFSVDDVCVADRNFNVELWVDPDGVPMVDCNAAGAGEIIFDLCGLTAEEKDNIWMWVATERKDQGEFELEISQKVGPTNDDCENPRLMGTQGVVTSDVNEVLCFEMSNLFACPETFDPDNVENPSNAPIACEEDPLLETTAGVWFEFTTDQDAGRIDITLNHDNEVYLGLLMYEVTGDCEDDMIMRACIRDTLEMGFIDIEAFGIDPETTYRILVYTDMEDAGDYELCINVKPPIECLGIAPYYYNHTEIICGLLALEDFCLFMGPAIMSFSWPGCSFCCAFHNPQWFTFVAGEVQTLSIDVFISECQNNQGVQIALYELDCDVPFDPSGQSDPIQPTEDMLVSDCSLVSSGQTGTVNFTVNTQPGQVYGIIVDGWASDQCKVEVQEVLSGGDPPDLEEGLIGEPEFDPMPPWDKDTICAGALAVPFALVGEVPNACTYIWTLENVDLMILDTLEVEDPTLVEIDFPEPGEYEVCVSATNLCASTEPVCRTVWVLPLTPELTIDTLCKREPYVWLGPFGEILETYEGFADDWGFGMNPNPGPFEDMRTAENEWGCIVDAFLELYVIPDNYLPTVGNEAYFQEVICFGDYVEMPDGSQHTQTGIFGTEGEIFIPQQSFPECDSFFILELSVLEVRLNWEDPFCLDNVIFIFPQDVPFPPEFLPGGAGQEIYIQWVRLSDNDTMYVGSQSAGTLLGGLVWEITPDDFNSDIETFEVTIIMDIDGEPDPGCLFGPWLITIDLNDLYPDEPDVTYPDIVCTDNLVTIQINEIFGFELEYEWEIMLDPSDYIIVNDSTETLLEIIFLTQETVEICITPFNLCGPGTPACFEIDVSEPPVSDAGPDDISCELTYTMQGGGDNGVWTVASRPMNSTVNFVDNTDPQTDVTVNLYGEYSFVWTERIGNLVSCATNDTVSIYFNEPPFITNIRYECDSLGQFYIATFDIVGETGPYTLVVGPGTIDSASYTSPLTPDLQPIEIVIADGNGCESDLFVLNVRCDCPTEVGQLNITALNLCEDDCFETENYYDDTDQVFVPGQDTLLFFLQTTNTFSVDEDDWVEVNDHGVFCGDVLDVELDVPYYVYVAVGPIDSLTGFIDLDLENFENCTRITQRKPITWRGQPIAVAFGGEICGVDFTLSGTASYGEGTWTQISGPGTIEFDDVNDVNTSITADLCGDYQLQWRESNFGCVDSVQVDVGLNCIPELGDVSFNCDNEDISYWLSFEIESGTQDFEVVYPVGYENAISGSTFTHPAVPNRGEVLDTFHIVDANGCELEIILDINCDCQPIPGEMEGDIDVCESQNQVVVGEFIDEPFFEPGDIGTFVLHTSPGTELVNPLVVNDAGVFNFDDTTGIECNVTYYISHVVGPPDSLGNVDFFNGCTRVGPGQPVLWRCEPTADAGTNPDPICGITVVNLSGTSTHGTGSWSGGSGEFANPDNPNTTYTPDSSEIGTVVTLTYTTEGDEGVCPSVTDEISILVDEERIADAGADQIFCEIEDVQLNANSNGEPGMWSGGSGTFNDATLNNAVYSPDASEQGEIITLTWTTTAGEGCPEESDAMTVEIVDNLTAVPGDDRIACFLSTNLSAELAGNLDGEWSSSDPGVVFGDVNNPSSEVTVPDLGTYCFTWTVSIGDCEHSDEVCITFVDAPVVVDTTFECNDISTQYFVTILIDGGDASSYTVDGDPITGNTFISDWIGSNQAATFIINDANNCGPYELNVRHVCECLTEVGSMNGPTQILCEDETANFTGFYNDSDEFLDGNDIRVYVLHDGDATDLGSIIAMNTTGTFGFGAGMNFEESYWVAVGVGDSLGNALDLEDPCRLFSNSVEVIWYEYPDASIATPDILTCAVTEVTITANIDEPYIDYAWSTTNGNIVGASDMREVVVSSVGTYTLVVTDTRSGCSSTDQITVTDDVTPPDVVIENPETLTCAVLEVQIDGSGSSSGNFTYEWSGPGIVANGTSPIVTVNAPGTYTLVVTSTTNGCVSQAPMTVSQDIVPPVAAASVNAELDCSTDEVTISAQGSSQGAIYTYSWEVDGVDGNIVSGANQFDAVVDESGIYQLVVTNTDNGCRDTTTIEVIEIDDVVTGAVITTAGIDCFGDRDGVLTIEEVEGGTPPYRYSFDGGATFGNNPERVNVNPGTYSIVIEDARGCIFETPVTLEEPDLLEVDLGPNVVVELGQTVTLTAEVNTDESNIEQWIWNPLLDPTCENCPDQVFLPEGETFVQLTVIDSNGCVATASVSVFITVVREIYIPNIFSPNRDGINDYFGIYTAPLRVREIKEFRIWDRWGEQMFHREGLPSPTELNETNAWDGIFNGELMQPGVFVYYIVVEFADGVEEVYKGDFTLMR